MDYFGQSEKKPCGICDICLEKKRIVKNSDKRDIDQKILTQLQQNDLELKELIHLVEEKRETVVERIRYLLETEKIVYKSPTLLGRAK